MSEKDNLLVRFDGETETISYKTSKNGVFQEDPVRPFGDEDMLDITTDARMDVSDLRDRSQGVSNLMSMPASGEQNQYDDFHTIDWLKDLGRDRFRHRVLEHRAKENIWHRLRYLHDAWSGWVCVFLVGLTSGCVAGVVDIAASWLTNLKEGICAEQFWFNQEHCCWSSNDNDTNGCKQWFTWPELFGIYGDGAGAYLLRYMFYVVWALIFSSLAVLLVRHVFRVPEARPPMLVSNVFTVLVAAPLLILLVLWMKLGANLGGMSFSPATLGFHIGLGAIIGLLYCYWTYLDMFTTLRYLTIIGIVTFFAANRMLRHKAAQRTKSGKSD